MLKKIMFLLLFTSGVSHAVTFDCSKARTTVEKLVCNTPSLSQADDELYVDYLQAKLVTGNSDEFKKIVRQNRKLREKNCDTEECQLNWYKRSTILYRNIAASKSEQDTDEKNNVRDSYKYGEQAPFKGIIQRESAGFPAIRLDDMISAHDNGSNPEITYPSEFGVAIMQLVINDDNLWNIFENYKGSEATVVCHLFHAETAHHKTPVMCLVQDIKPKIKRTAASEVKSSVKRSKISLDDFLKDNPELNTFYIKRAIKMQAAGLSVLDSTVDNSGESNKSTLKRAEDSLNENGYEYAKLAMRQLQQMCSSGLESMHSLRGEDCAVINNYREK
ncbi:DUF4431 domain-containing protein [Morganella morganii]|uniref:DUF4431 domain-containing protein n=1 Tax=Morganella morganii TaxID=582 RepID=UPI001FFD3643|nr:DUF4431 domain-containing protein [Morganella morganii]